MMSDTVWNIFIRFCDSFSLQPPLFSASTLAFSDSYFFLMGPPPIPFRHELLYVSSQRVFPIYIHPLVDKTLF